ncbi:hypothetical protein ASG25_21120 [Rhizobium sp. Leaf384]|uniref:DNA cytosine methyltransferase n=1 Tax=unclassified Rhizobium TaxID=2613769 RepID=UPI00071316A3|nr:MULTISPECIES: DNA (cytosine-5-)-methyltransferase [unclassified Rhizobium]KQS74300.1 hypothetical protein ASG25_21120 [Rhizobium sp. Leaf384]KQS83943.1 hypothetical protein ASG58_21500 [Rhizobium sp. Leaf383]
MDHMSYIPDPLKIEQARTNRLKDLSGKVIRARITLSKTLMRIGDYVDLIRADIPAEQLKSFIQNDCKIPRAEAATFIKLATKLGPFRDVITERAVGFPALKAIVAADADVRAEIVSAIAAGTSIDSADVQAAKRRHVLEREDTATANKRQRKAALGKLARARARTVEAEFEDSISALARLMSDYFFDETSDSGALQEKRSGIKSTAAVCLLQFEARHDIAKLLPEWEIGLHSESDGAVKLTRAHLALKALANGQLFDYDTDGTPFDTEYPIDPFFFNSIAWLSGNVVEPVDTTVNVAPKSLKSTIHSDAPHSLVSLEICAGAGGEALGLHAAGFRAKAIYEKNPRAVATLRQHPFSLKDRIYEADIRTIDFTRYRGKIDLVAGGVPCQGHSSSGKRKGKNDERDLFLEAVRIVDEVRPRAFLFENVEGFAESPNIDYRAELHDKFEALGYSNRVFMLRGSDYGLGQHRPRVAFIGFRDGEMSRFRMPPTFAQWSPTVASAIGDLVAANGWRGYEAWAAGAKRVGPTIIGGSETSGKLAFGDKRQSKAWEPLGIDVSSLQKDAPGPDHEGLFKLTLKMGQRLQGFPDDWKFQGTPMQVKCQIGNAFPPVMAKAIGLAIYSALEGVEFDYEAALKQPFHTPTMENLYPKRDIANLNAPDRATRLEEEMRFFGEFSADPDDG